MKKTVKICIYNKSSSKNDVLLGNGDAILDNICIECKVTENINGDYDLDAEFIIDNDGLYKYIEEEAILKVRLDYGYEYFRIIKPRKTTNRIVVYARQVTIYETMHLWLTDVRPENQNGLGALNWILNGATGNKELEVSSDISATSTAYYMDMNMYEALHDCDQCFTNRWGGEIQRRGYKLTINNTIGSDRGVMIRSRKNLTGFEANTNIDNIVTRIKPKGFDGITIDGYVDSENINKYPRVKTKEIKYENVKVMDSKNPDGGYETLAEAQAELTRLANLEYTQNHIDVITAEYTISFVDLSKTEEYKNFVQAERVYLGDTVDVYEEKLDIHVAVRAIERTYDVLSEKVEEIKLSNKDLGKIQTLSDILTDILKGVQENDNSLQLYIQNVINSGIQDSYVFYNKAELVICDTPKIEDAVNVWRFNRGGLAHSSNGYSGPYNVAITYDGKINADMILAGLIKGNYIDARNLTVTRTDGTKTLEVTAGGDVNLNVNSLKIQSEDVATKSLVTQTSNSLTASFNSNAAYNLLHNSKFLNKDIRQWYYWGDAATWETKTDFADDWIAWGVPKDQQGGLWQKGIKLERNTTYTLSTICSWEANCRGVEFVIEYLSSESDTTIQYTQVIPLQNLWWTRQYVTFTSAVDFEYCMLGFRYLGSTNLSTDYLCFINSPCLAKGTTTVWSPNPQEVYDGIITLDRSGIEIDQGYNTCKIDSQALNFYSSGTNYSRIEGGQFVLTDHYGNMVGSIGRTEWNNGSFYNALTAVAGQTAGISTQDEVYGPFYINLLASSYAGSIDNIYYERGLNLIEPTVHTALYFRPYNGTQYGGKHIIANYGDEHGLAVMGINETAIGVLDDNGSYKVGLFVTKDTNQPNYTSIRLNGPLDCGGFEITNTAVSQTMEMQSEPVSTFSLRNSIPTSYTIYGSMTFTKDEVRYVESEPIQTMKEYDYDENYNYVPTGRFIAYCELPQVLAENIEENYHINIGKRSWGDYRILESNPYYFILESKEEGFSFTFEVTAKRIETYDNNSIIANNNISEEGEQS